MLTKVSNWIVSKLEDVFGWYGRFVASHPFIMILSCFLVTGLACIGMIRYRTENNAFKLWIPDNSDFVTNYAWLEENSPPDIRFNSLILAVDDGSVLTKEHLLHIHQIHQVVSNAVTKNGLRWRDVCYDLTVPSQGGGRQIDPNCLDPSERPTPWLAPCYPDSWCAMVEFGTQSECFEKSLLELWGYEFDYSTLTDEDIIKKVNEEPLESAVFKTPINIKDYLGDITEENGRIVAAKATTMQWYGKINTTDITPDDISNMGTGEIVDQNSLEWEEALRDILMEDQDSLEEGTKTFINVARGYSDIAGETIGNDAIMMPIGFMIVFVYVTIMLGKFTCLEQRAILALCGLACIGLTIGFTYGFCSALNLFYGPMHNLIPFLLLGIGIDDMFVIMQCFDNLTPEERGQDISETISLTMRRAGVAITVTSLTDFMVFAIGSSTVLPALRSFCLWCGVGILAVYLYQVTLFVACLALDCRRLRSQRNGLCPCYVHKKQDKETEATKTSDQHSNDLGLSQKCFKFVSKLILSTPGAVVVLLCSSVLSGCAIWQATQLEQEFQSIWFLPPSSYLRQWFDANAEYFPSDGERVTVYLTQLDWPQELGKFEKLVDSLENSPDIIKSVDSWYYSFKEFSNSNLGANIPNEVLDNTTFNTFLTQYLFNADRRLSGLRYKTNFKFRNGLEVECGEPSPDILLSSFTFTHVKFSGRGEHIPALHKVKDLIDDCQFSGNVFPFNQEYSNWETDEVITKELFRNLGIAMACVFVTTLLLLADFFGSVIVLFTVAITLVNLCGFMHTWGITIDVVSAVNVIIAIGLCVDYSVHICHAFLTVSGTRKDRAIAAMVDMGPAVLNGGISTLIAFILLAGSESHVFSVFFRVFLLVVAFGLFHGLILLPVILSLIGPSPYLNSKPANEKSTNDSNKDQNSIKL